MGRRKKMVERVQTLMDKPEFIRNIGIVAHIDHGKTTLSDNLLAGAGMISKELAGTQLFMDYDEEEQQRGITINAANVSMVHTFEEQEYLINLIDTPGHVDFGGDVTRAMRAVDGALVVVDAVEGTMPQTETVLRQALKENVKPVLFINKVDRLINELKVDSQEMQVRLGKVIDHVNKLIKGMRPEKYKEWRMDAANGTVAFGSALYNWAVSVPFMAKTKIGFNEVYDYCKNEDMKSLAQKCPLHEVVNDMIIRFMPNPLEAQKERINVIWHGDPESEIGKSMINVDPSGDVALMVTKILTDPHAGEIAAGRLFSGTLRRGAELYISGTAVNEETGEHLMAGMGELHLEVVGHRIERDKNVEIITSTPLVVYRETIQGAAGPVEGKSPNRHNRFYVEVEPMKPEVVELIKSGSVSMKMPEIDRRNLLIGAGMTKDEAKGITHIFESNIYIDMTKGVQYLRETMELILEGFEEVMKEGPLSREPCQGVQVKLVDVKLHEDAVHRGPAQVIPASRQAIQAATLMAGPTLLEPYQKVFIQVPQEQMGGATREIQGRRGMILNMQTEGDTIILEAKAPVAELFGFAGDLRSATEGRAMWSTEFAGFETIPANMLKDVVKGIRQRKGLKPEPPKASDFMSR